MADDLNAPLQGDALLVIDPYPLADSVNLELRQGEVPLRVAESWLGRELRANVMLRHERGDRFTAWVNGERQPEAVEVKVRAKRGRAPAGAREEAPMAIDFNDEDAVLAEVARAIDVPVEDLTIREERGLSSFGAGTVYEVATRGGRQEWAVVESEDQERELALEVVKQDLEQEPELFDQSFIEGHIDRDRLRRDLYSDALDSNIESLTDTAERYPDDFWRDYEREGFDAPEEDEEGNRPDPDQTEIEALAEKYTEEQLRDPMQYLEDIYGEDAAKRAIEIAGIDIDGAADEAVSTDGPAHFLAHYDGNSYVTPSGLVYWRVN